MSQARMEKHEEQSGWEDDDVFVFPASFAQQRLWFLNQLDPDSSFYNVPTVMHLRGKLNVEVLRRSLAELVRRHESLRTTFAMVNGEPVQIIRPSRTVDFSFIEASSLPAEHAEEEALRIITAEAQRPFDLEQGPLMRVLVAQFGAEDYLALLNLHHIVCDAWSKSVLVKDLSVLYEDFSHGPNSSLPELPIQYADYTQWQREWLQGEVLDAQLAYWRQQLHESAPVLQLPTDRPRPPIQTYNGAILPYSLPPELVRSLQGLGNSEGATLFMVMLAAFKAVLYLHSGQSDIIVGTPIAGRPRAELEGLIGFFVNTLALRTTIDGEQSFRSLLRRVREGALEAYARQDLPFEKLVEDLQPDRNLSFTPLFQVVFALQNSTPETLDLAGLRWALKPLPSSTAKFDLTMLLVEEFGWLTGSIEYNTDLFDEATVSRLLEHFTMLLEGIAADPDKAIAGIQLLTDDERRLLLTDWNGVTTAYPRTSCIQELFEQQVAKDPHAVALIFGEQRLSYTELNARANQLAHRLRSLGVGPEVRVGICLERTANLILALLGILKAGGAYVPLDAAYPKERLAYMLRDANPCVLLTDMKSVAALPVGGSTRLLFDNIEQELATESVENPRCETVATNLAYIMYTSGSTGIPKGVSVTHRSVVRLVRETNFVEFATSDVFLQFAPISFDASTFEIWGSLLNGASLVVMPGGSSSLEELAAALQQHEVTTLWLTAGLFHLMVDEQSSGLSTVRQLLAGGDVLSVSHIQKCLNDHPGCRVINGYGPTENTTFTCCHPMTDADSIGASVPIGRPIANTTAYIVDSRLRAVPLGVVGELVSGGDGLARGYYNCPELTAEKFVPDPFSKQPGGRLYRTGDLARYRPDGSIEFIGRVDQQVKVRGFRVELDEIEFRLNQYAGVDQSVVVATSNGSNEKQLVAYIVADSRQVNIADLRDYLRETLPEFMQPSHFVVVNELPLTPNGKVDRQALPAIGESEARDRKLEPGRTPMEELLCGIWGEVLGLPEVGRAENFFELGGHSLSATRVMARVRAVTGQALALRELFEAPTVAQLAARLAGAQSVRDGEAGLQAQDSEVGPAPLSSAQQRLWFIDQLEPGSAAYNIPAAVRLRGELNVEALRLAFSAVVRRQESLRTIFPLQDGEPVQVVQPATEWDLPVVDLRGRGEAEREQELAELAAATAEGGFDLAGGPLLRTSLVRLGEQEYVLLLVMHHIISDGWSLGVLVQELAAHYERYAGGAGSELPELALQYRDYARWQRKWLATGHVEEQLQYWQEALAGAPPLLELPLDRARGAVLAYRGDAVSVRLGAELSGDLKGLARRQGATLFMVLLAAFKTLLFRYTGQTDLVVGTPVAGRLRAELEPLIGLFVNTLALRTRLSGAQSFRELLGGMRETALGAYAHQELPFDTLVEHLQPDRSLSHHPLFQVMFIVQNTPAYTLSLPGLTLSAEPFSKAAAQFDLVLSLTETRNEIVASAQYSTSLFDEATIKNLLEHFRNLLESVVANPEGRVSDLPLITKAEEEFVTKQLNNNEAPYPDYNSIHEIFQAQARLTPNSLALIHQGRRLTYNELDRHSNQLANHLITLGVGPESLVGVLMDRSLESVIALLGILKAGGAYVPLDAAYPGERLAYMLRDSGAKVLVTKDRFMASLPEHNAHVVRIDTDWERIAQQSADDPAKRTNPQHGAYVIYTSGSTGQPKGVLGLHRGAVNRFNWMWTRYPFADGDVCCQKTSLSFVDGVWEVFGPLLRGVPTVIFNDDVVKDTDRFIDELARHGVTRLVLVPSLLRVILGARDVESKLAKLNYCVCSGEALPAELARTFQQRLPHCILLNLYGSSEASADATYHEVAKEQDGSTISIGRPLSNVQVYILDDNLQPLPVGARGELYVGGDALARGYIQRPDLTAERFVPDAFGGRAGGRLYRTGDIARLLANGDIEFLGRVDHQVKVRGYRIELEEIEAVLKEHAAVREAIVMAREDVPGDVRLIAYLVAEQSDDRELREHLRRHLLDYMMPAAFVFVDALPLTPNGKVNRQALPAPQTSTAPQHSFEPPRNTTEQEIADLWTEVLAVERVGIDDNFFELGGHSLLATQMISRVRMNFGIDLDLRKFFLSPTVRNLADLVEQNLFATADQTKLAGMLELLDDLQEDEAKKLAMGN